VRGTTHVNGIEGFWGVAERRLQKFNGVPAQTFSLRLKECEYRPNDRRENLYRAWLKLLRSNPLQTCFATPEPT
jgi:transposase-like protein